MPKGIKFEINKEELEKAYKDDPCTERVGKKFGVGHTCILKWLKKYSIPVHKGGKAYHDLTGKRFGKLAVIEKAKSDKYTGKTKWKCRCDCGKEKVVVGVSLRKGLTTSCGCYHKKLVYRGYEDLSSSYWKGIIRGAKRRSLKFSITMKYAWSVFEKQNKKCAISGREIVMAPDHARHRDKQTASLDRIDSSKGYIKGNIQWVHKNVNIAKQSLSSDEFVKLCREVVQFAKGG